MRLRLFLTTFLIFYTCASLYARRINYSFGISGGYIPSLGGNLSSYIQEDQFGSKSGIDGINRSKDGYSTSHIDRLDGSFLGFNFKTVIYEFYLIQIGAYYCQNVRGGTGDTVFTKDNTNYYILECEYIFSEYDFPLTIGLSIPFWKDFKINLAGGISAAYGKYEYSFKSNTYSDPFTRKGSFSGWAFPMVILLEGEYFISKQIALNSCISYYNGSSRVHRDSHKSDTGGLDGEGAVDYAKINFSGYRYSFGFLYYFYSI
ncbi:MAG: hypothetical protein SVR08_06055 [Spirochaetota bacterium]|nr:hypothetical protein [Spirochaetota bacterium]